MTEAEKGEFLEGRRAVAVFKGCRSPDGKEPEACCTSKTENLSGTETIRLTTLFHGIPPTFPLKRFE